MGTKPELRRRDLSIVAIVGSLFAAVAWAARMSGRGEPAQPDSWWTPVLFLLVSFGVTGALIAIQRMRPPHSVFAAALPGFILALIPLAVSFVFGDLTTRDSLIRPVTNLAAIPAASILIYVWSRRRAGLTENIGRTGPTPV